MRWRMSPFIPCEESLWASRLLKQMRRIAYWSRMLDVLP